MFVLDQTSTSQVAHLFLHSSTLYTKLQVFNFIASIKKAETDRCAKCVFLAARVDASVGWPVFVPIPSRTSRNLFCIRLRISHCAAKVTSN